MLAMSKEPISRTLPEPNGPLERQEPPTNRQVELLLKSFRWGAKRRLDGKMIPDNNSNYVAFMVTKGLLILMGTWRIIQTKAMNFLLQNLSRKSRMTWSANENSQLDRYNKSP